MYFLGIGIVLLLLKFFDIGFVARWDWMEHWYLFAGPFILAAAWWAYADWSGYTKKKAMEKMDLRKQDRLARNRDAMGMGPAKKVPKKR
jgi:small Trp-rich protein